jgi:hypothetical protein
MPMNLARAKRDAKCWERTLKRTHEIPRDYGYPIHPRHYYHPTSIGMVLIWSGADNISSDEYWMVCEVTVRQQEGTGPIDDDVVEGLWAKNGDMVAELTYRGQYRPTGDPRPMRDWEWDDMFLTDHTTLTSNRYPLNLVLQDNQEDDNGMTSFFVPRTYSK